MNERIKQLVKQAGGHFSTHNLMSNPVQHRESIELWDKNIEKFAELIVKEMLQTCEDHPAWTGRMIGEQIKQDFGVEELKGWVCPKCGVDRTKAVCPKGHTASLTGDCPMVAEAQ